MAANNILAERNDCGQALVFLDPNEEPDINLDYLNKYLACLLELVQKSRNFRDRAVAQRRIESAARYLVETDGVDGGSVNQVTHLANRLSKWVHVPACGAALSWAAGEIVATRPLRASPKEASLLFNAFSKSPDDQACAAATLMLANELRDRPAWVVGFTGQGIGNTLNALSKMPKSETRIRAMEAVARRILRTPPELNALVHGQDIGLALNGLSKAADESDVCRSAMATIARNLCHTPALVKGFSPHDTGLALNALSKLSPRESIGAIEILAKGICDWPRKIRADAQSISQALNALAGFPDNELCSKAIQIIAQRICDTPALADGFERAINMSVALEGLARFWNTKVCVAAIDALARRICVAPKLRKDFGAQDIGMSLHALGKVRSDACAEAVGAIAQRVCEAPTVCDDFNEQDLSQVLNTLSKFPKNETCVHAMEILAQGLRDGSRRVDLTSGQTVGLLLCALSKLHGNEVCAEAMCTIARRIREMPKACDGFAALDVALALEALGRLSDDRDCAAAIEVIAGRICAAPERIDLLPVPDISVALDAMRKQSHKGACRRATEILAAKICETPIQRDDSARKLSLALNALAKLLGSDVCVQAMEVIAEGIQDMPALADGFGAHEASLALNALSKVRGSEKCIGGQDALVRRICELSQLGGDFNFQDLSLALNALSKRPKETTSAARILAANLLGRSDELDDAKGCPAMALAAVANALSRFEDVPPCKQALELILDGVGENGRAWNEFDIYGLALIANALMRHASDDDDSLARTKLREMAHHLDAHRELLARAEVIDVGIILRALARMRMVAEMRPIAPTAMERIGAEIQRTSLRGEDLETMGTVCMGLFPLVCNRELKVHRSRALKLLDQLQPVVARKLDRFLLDRGQVRAKETSGVVPQEGFATRCEGLTFYQILKTFKAASDQWTRTNIEGTRHAIGERRTQLAEWVDATLSRTRDAIEDDLEEMSWNLIAHIEAGQDVLDALDLRMLKKAPQIAARHPPSRFDVDEVYESMRGPPRAVAAGIGDTVRVLVDVRGRRLKSEGEGDGGTQKPYSLFARLTGLPLTEVKLPGELSTLMLARTFCDEKGEPWRFDMAGGNRMSKGRQLSVQRIFAGERRGYGVLPAIRYSDSAPGSDLTKLFGKLAPQREDWSRLQRALLETVPHDHVLEGTMQIGWFKDVPGPQHPFKLHGPLGEHIQVCPNDGCGFLKWETAMRIPVVRVLMEAWRSVENATATQAQRELVASLSDVGSSRMPSQAIQHFPRDDEAIAESSAHLARILRRIAAEKVGAEAGKVPSMETIWGRAERAERAPRDPVLAPVDIDKALLHGLMTGGGYEGIRARAVPSADDKVHLPRQLSKAFDEYGGDLLVGKPPYDKENLLPIEASRVATEKHGDSTARFLGEQCLAIQYSYTGFDDGSGSARDMLHSKGMLIVPFPGFWPKEYANLDMVCSSNDLKTFSKWVRNRDRDSLAPTTLSTGSLRIKELLAPGRLGALPIRELRKRDMDTDGDDAFIYAGYPKLAASIGRAMKEREARRGIGGSFKPPKTAHAARDESGHYRAGRAKEILDAQRGNVLVGKASTAAMRFLAQPDAVRERMATDFMLGTYDGIAPDLSQDLRRLIEEESARPEKLAPLLDQAERAIDHAHAPEAREAAVLLRGEIARWLRRDERQPVRPVPAALARRFPWMARDYAAGKSASERIEAILDGYPVCLFPRSQFPQGQPGFIDGEPELSARCLFVMAVKAGTDALKADTQAALFLKVIRRFEDVEGNHEGRVRNVPYSKDVARALRDDCFNAEKALSALSGNNTLAAGIMEASIKALQRAKVLDKGQRRGSDVQVVRRAGESTSVS